MQADFAKLPRPARYKLLASVVVPRPIAWVTTLGPSGRLNAAPSSFFNMFGDDPPILALGIILRATGALKDTAANIRSNNEFVVNMVGQPAAVAMNQTSIDAPPETSEVELFGIETAPSARVRPPRIVAAPVNLECRLQQIVTVLEAVSKRVEWPGFR